MEPTPQDVANWRRFHDIFAHGFLHEALGAAAELGIADKVEEHPVPTAKIAAELKLDEGALFRLMRTLAAHGIFAQHRDRCFSHTSFSRQLRKTHPYSIQPMAALWHSAPFREPWGKFSQAIRDGRSAFLHAHGTGVYDYLKDATDAARTFHAGMEANSAIVADLLARGFPFGDHGNVIDLGGGTGALLATILNRHPGISGAVFDREELSPFATDYLASQNLTARAKFIGGDWFKEVPREYGVYIVKNSLWNWQDQECSRILGTIANAMSAHSQLLLIEYLVCAEVFPWSAAFDLQQLNITGGRGRTKDEYAGLLAANGLQIAATFSIENQNVLHCRKAIRPN